MKRKKTKAKKKANTKKQKTKKKRVDDGKVLREVGHFRAGRPAQQGGTDGGAGAVVTPEGFIRKLDELVSADDIIEAGRRMGAIKRQRKVDLPALVKATVAAMSPVPGAETSAMVNYLWITGVPLVPSSFYDRFSPEFAELMRELAVRAIGMVREVSPSEESLNEYGALLEQFDDVQAADASCAMLKRLARPWAPSTSKKRPAGIKINAVISLGDQLPTAADVTAQRRHDNNALPEDALKPNTLTFFDLGYIDLHRFVDMTKRGAFFLTRLKDSHDPVIQRVHVGRGRRREARGLRVNKALEKKALEFQRGVVDLDVILDDGKRQVIGRVVGIANEDGKRWWYLTNVGREVLPAEDVAGAYGLRWDIELLFKQLKSGAGLKAVLAWRSSAVLAFLYAKIVALALTRLLELSVEERYGPHATTKLALLLTLSRTMPLMLSLFMQQQQVTLAEFEDRILMIASIVARSRRQRRERAKRKKRQQLGKRTR
jgi:IS4 transposase